MPLPWLLLLVPLTANANVANYNYTPRGNNPRLYDVGDGLVQLDETTFADTVVCEKQQQMGAPCTAMMVEFYADWCGYCRRIAGVFKELAADTRSWRDVVRLGVINCADAFNQKTCSAENITSFPTVKFFPRNTSSPSDAWLVPHAYDTHGMRDILTEAVLDDYSANKFPDWPKFEKLTESLDVLQSWAENVGNVAVVFEDNTTSPIGAQLLLDLAPQRHRMIARRAASNHPLAAQLNFTDFPALAILTRGSQKPALAIDSSEGGLLRYGFTGVVNDFLSTLDEKERATEQRNQSAQTCTTQPNECKQRYYVAEVDMLKALRSAVLYDPAMHGATLNATATRALRDFVTLLRDFLPTSTTANGGEMALARSQGATRVFNRMLEYLAKVGDGPLDIDDWQSAFVDAERQEGSPFPIGAAWAHCAGSTPQLRGYTCGLWTAFHAITVAASKQQNRAPPMATLGAIRGWVANFLACRPCRNHFVNMTTQSFSMEQNVRSADDVYKYLWKAHNIVNGRLQGDAFTEDPQFLKYQFPAPFLCPNCYRNGNLSDSDTAPFLLKYYSDIQPFNGPVENAILRRKRFLRYF